MRLPGDLTAQLDQLLGASPIGAMALGRDGIVWWANDRAYVLIGTRREASPPPGEYDVFADRDNHGDEMIGHYRGLLEEGTTFETILRFDRGRTGFYRGQEDTRSLYIWGSPLRHEGELVGGLVQYRDATAEVEALHERDLTEARLRSFMEQSRRGVWCYEPTRPIDLQLPVDEQFELLLEATLVDCNHTYALLRGGSQPSDIIGGSLRELSRSQVGVLRPLYEQTIRDGGQLSKVELDQATAGGPRVVEASVLAVIEDDHLVRIWGTFDDITEQREAERERRRLEAQLRHAQRIESIGELAGGVAHDFNNALVVILGNAELARRLTSDDNVVRCLDDIQKAGEGAAELTRQLLTFGRKQGIDRKRIVLAEFIQRTTRLLRRLIPESIELRVETDDAIDELWVDAGQVQQILINLAVNARDAIGLSGRITIRASKVVLDAATAGTRGWAPGPYVRLTVADTGKGMSSQTQARIFEPFFTTKREGEGTGLGLSIVFSIVRQHRGHITVDSSVGAGTAFHIHLPLEEEGAPTTEPPAPVMESMAPASLRVLLAEDDPLVRNVATQMLERAGYVTTVVADGNEALDVFEADPDGHDVVLLDAVMPGRSGPDVTARIRELRPDQPVVVCSGYADQFLEPYVRAPRVSKPYTYAELIGAVRSALAEGGD